MRRRCLPSVLLLAGISLVPAIGASAQLPTTTTTAPGGALSVAAPASSSLSTATPTGSTSLSAHLGSVTVTDGRGLLNTGWAATVTATGFTTGGGTPAETIPSGNVSYWSGPATATSGVGVFVPGQLTALDAADLSVARTAFTGVTTIGSTAATWDPTLTVTIPANAIAGTYAGTVTHSVA